MTNWIEDAEIEIQRKKDYFHTMTLLAKKEIESVLAEARKNDLKVSEAVEGMLTTFSYDPPTKRDIFVKRIQGSYQVEYHDWGYSWYVEAAPNKFTYVELKLCVGPDGMIIASNNGANVEATIKTWLTQIL